MFITSACGDVQPAPLAVSATDDAQLLLNAKPCAHALAASGALVYANPHDSSETRLMCSGTLIRPDVVLTAAHCLSDVDDVSRNPFNLGLYFTNAKNIQTAQAHERVEVQSFVAHPGYIGGDDDLLLREPRNAAEHAILDRMDERCGTHGGPHSWSVTDHLLRAYNRMTPEMMTAEKRWYECVRRIDDDSVQKALGSLTYDEPAQDVALVFLKAPVDGVKPAQLPQALTDVQLGRAYPISGYGRHVQSDDTIIVKNSGLKKCGTATFTGATQTELGYDDGPPLACFGDSGGGAFVSQEPGAAIIGVLSRGDVLPFSLRCRGEGVLTKVSAYVPWIEQELNRRDASQRH